MLLLAGILVGGLSVWYAIKIGFYETWAMLFNVVIAIYIALFLARPIVNFLPEETGNIPCCEALTVLIVAVGIAKVFAIKIISKKMKFFIENNINLARNTIVRSRDLK